MDIARSVILCHECGKAVRLPWHLYCDDCYGSFKGVRYHNSREVRSDRRNSDAMKRDDRGRVYVYDRSGRRYVLDGKAWRRDSGR